MSIIKEIIEQLKKELIITNKKTITQNQFDAIIEELIKEDKRELMWRLCGSYNNYNYNKVIDYYIEKKDSYYIEELVSFTHGELDQHHLTEQMLKTKDKQFIKSSLEECGQSMQYSMDPKYLEELLDYIKQNN